MDYYDTLAHWLTQIVAVIDAHPLLVATITLLLAALFAGVEIAFLSADKLSLELDIEQDTFWGRLRGRLLRHPDRFMSTTLIGNTIALVIYTTYAANLIDPWLQTHLPPSLNHSIAVLVLQTLLTTITILVFAEFIPKSIFMHNPNRLLAFFTLPIAVFAYLFRPLVIVTTAITRSFITHVLRQPYRESPQRFGLADLHSFINNILRTNKKVPAHISAKMISKLIEFRQLKVRDCMTPRAELVAVAQQDGIETLQRTMRENEYNKVLIYDKNIDHIIGYCHAKALLSSPQEIEQVLTPIIVVPATSPASEAMMRLANERSSLALVVDEFGGTSGIISMEDIIEEIVGEIQNENDPSTLLEAPIDEHTYLLSARHEIDYLREKYGWDLPDGDYDTLGGFIISVIARIPDLDEVVTIPPFSFTIVSLQDTRIDTVKLTLSPTTHHEIY